MDLQNNLVFSNLRKNSILLIEDNPDHVEIIKAAASESMPETSVVTAYSPASAISFLENILSADGILPQLVLLDLYLPKREDGWMVLQKIKNHAPKLALLPVIVLSSSDCQQDISDAYKYGSTAYTIKPMSYQAWLTYFTNLRRHWLETVSLPVHL